MTTATEITTVLQDIVSTVDQAKNLIDGLVDDNEERKEEERRGQMALEILEIVWRLHDSQVNDGRVVCPTCQVSWPCETAQAIRYTECFPF
jgi:hypothetical protein